MQHKTVFLIVLSFFSISTSIAQVMNTSYSAQIEAWHTARIASLTSESGWLTVAGLFWLKDGENTIGSSKQNSVILAKGKAEEQVGFVTLKNESVWFDVLPGIDVKVKDSSFTSGIIYGPEIKEQTVVLAHKNLRWFIIKRGTKYGLRLRDLTSDARIHFSGIDCFPIDEKWKINARYEAPKKGFHYSHS